MTSPKRRRTTTSVGETRHDAFSTVKDPSQGSLALGRVSLANIRTQHHKIDLGCAGSPAGSRSQFPLSRGQERRGGVPQAPHPPAGHCDHREHSSEAELQVFWILPSPDSQATFHSSPGLSLPYKLICCPACQLLLSSENALFS